MRVKARLDSRLCPYRKRYLDAELAQASLNLMHKQIFRDVEHKAVNCIYHSGVLFQVCWIQFSPVCRPCQDQNQSMYLQILQETYVRPQPRSGSN